MTQDKHETNLEFVTRVMESSRTGPIMQMFVIDALTKAVDRTLENATEIVEAMKHGFVSGEAWIACAHELHEELTEKYGR